MSADLLPCPFCGGTAIVENSNELNAGAFVWHVCGDCGVETEGLHGRECARKLWNTRASASVTPGPDTEEVATVAEREGSREAIPPIPYAMGEGEPVAWRVVEPGGYVDLHHTKVSAMDHALASDGCFSPLFATRTKAVTISEAMVERADRAFRREPMQTGITGRVRAALTAALSADEGGRS